IVEEQNTDQEPVAEATVRVRVKGMLEHTAASGNGPVDALDHALRKALEEFYPNLKTMKLLDYKVRILDESKGTAAKTRVLIMIVEEQNTDQEPVAEATVRVRVKGMLEHTAASGNGPVDALDHALRKALEEFYPNLKTMKLLDYKVRILDESKGTAAKTRVLI